MDTAPVTTMTCTSTAAALTVTAVTAAVTAAAATLTASTAGTVVTTPTAAVAAVALDVAVAMESTVHWLHNRQPCSSSSSRHTQLSNNNKLSYRLSCMVVPTVAPQAWASRTVLKLL